MIDYKIIDDSIKFYENIGFKRIESPWTVTESVINITKPKDSKAFKLVHDDNKCLVGSGEQSFLYLYLKGFLPKDKFQTVTPCYRGDSFDETHTKYFIKNELIITDDVRQDVLECLVVDATNFFATIFPREFLNTVLCSETNSYDITFDGEELGSYGIRECSFLRWIYGTGAAEPRITCLKQKYGLSFK